MLYATTIRIAASTDSGMYRASGAATSSTTSSVSAWTMPATGVRAPERMLVAVRAIAPVAGRPPNSGDAMLAIALRDELDVRVVAVAAHPVGDDRRHQRLDRAEHRDRQRRRKSTRNQIEPKPRQGQGAAARWECRRIACRSSRLEAGTRRRRPCRQAARRCSPASCGTSRRQTISATRLAQPSAVAATRYVPRPRAMRDHARPELAGHVDAQAEEVLDLRAGDQHGDAVGEADDDRPRNELHRRAQARHAQHDEDDARHHGAHEQAVEAVGRDDAGDDHDERAGRSADLGARSAERRNQEAGDDRAVDAGLRA